MKELKEITLNFLSECEGYHQLCKGLHWSTSNKAEHLLVDNIDDEVLSFQDRVAEAVMGMTNDKFGIGELKTLLPNSKTVESMLNELEEDTLSFKDGIGEDNKRSGLINILDELLESINKFKYLRTLK